MRFPVRAFVLFLSIAAVAVAAEWPQFRGVDGGGVSKVTRLPAEFGPSKNVIWKTDLPQGHSSPVIDGNRIFLTAAIIGKKKDAPRSKMVDEGGRLFTICLDRNTGKMLWQKEAPRPRLEEYQATNSPASPSPVVDGKNVYVFFGDYGLIAYNYDGVEQWKKPLGPFNNTNGHGSSPILYGNLLIMLCDQDTNSYLLAVEKDTGKVHYKVERPDFTRCYSTPAVFHPKQGPAELIVPGAYNLTSYNAGTGERLWWINGLSWQPKSMPIIDGDMIYVHWYENGGEAEGPTETPAFSEMLAKFDANKDGKISKEELAADPRQQRGFADNDLNGDGFIDERDWKYYTARRSARNSLLAIKHGGRGDLTESKNILWRMQKFLPNVPSPLLYEGVLYLVKDGGIVTTLNPKTGEILKQGRLTGALETYYSSPVGGAGRVIMTSQRGKVSVLKAGEQWEILYQVDMEDDVFATPALVDNKIYFRTRNSLYCFGEPNTLTAEEVKDGWKLLFDGKTFNGWERAPESDSFSIEDGSIKVMKKPRLRQDLYSAEKYRDFELQWDWKISPGGNSGLKYRIQDRIWLSEEEQKKFEDWVEYSYTHRPKSIPAKGQEYVVSFEYQMIDNGVHKDALRGPKYQTGALYDMIPPVKDAAKPVGEFNHSRLIVKGKHVEHWLNGEKVLDASLDDPAVAAGSAKRWGENSHVYKFLTSQPAKDCQFSLQNHDDEAWFRNIKVKRLN